MEKNLSKTRIFFSWQETIFLWCEWAFSLCGPWKNGVDSWENCWLVKIFVLRTIKVANIVIFLGVLRWYKWDFPTCLAYLFYLAVSRLLRKMPFLSLFQLAGAALDSDQPLQVRCPQSPIRIHRCSSKMKQTLMYCGIKFLKPLMSLISFVISSRFFRGPFRSYYCA